MISKTFKYYLYKRLSDRDLSNSNMTVDKPSFQYEHSPRTVVKRISL